MLILERNLFGLRSRSKQYYYLIRGRYRGRKNNWYLGEVKWIKITIRVVKWIKIIIIRLATT